MTKEGKHGQCLLDRTPGVKADSNFAGTACKLTAFLSLLKYLWVQCWETTNAYEFRNPSLRSTYVISIITHKLWYKQIFFHPKVNVQEQMKSLDGTRARPVFRTCGEQLNVLSAYPKCNIYRVSERVKLILQRQSAAMKLWFNAFLTNQFRNIGYMS